MSCDPCIQALGDQIDSNEKDRKDNQITWEKIPVPICKCELIDGKYKPKTTQLNIQVIKNKNGSERAKVKGYYEELAKANKEICLLKNLEPVVAVPETWALNPGGDIPQVVCSFGEKRQASSNKLTSSGYRTLTIPHPNFRAKNLPKLRLPVQKRGQYYAEAVLKDNTKIRVYLSTERDAINYLKNVIKKYVLPSYWGNTDIKKIIRTGIRSNIKTTTLYPIKVEYYRYGAKGNVIAESSHRFI